MPTFELLSHPSAPSATVRAITVTATRPARDRIALEYRIHGGLDAIRWPDPAASDFAHELWMHTCFEAFVAGEGDFYRELNLSPSTRYAIYDFNGYRGRMRDADERDIAIAFDRATATLTAEVAMPALADVDEWRLGLTTVVEDISGAKSFWALSHPRDEPDFHNQAGFVARLAAPLRA
ncbi:DOMON-like domain-containing protein [Sphingomonas sp. Leaf412]|uniref:DOMON-like domain-containing protein n=1 Tax=Sphingomonas sp. Leaf412 TaxID=1736370 RepID=UPI0006F3B16E|nr:DOMON-like domain-containing protein [Sphingomonas sp. Leaf412]